MSTNHWCELRLTQPVTNPELDGFIALEKLYPMFNLEWDENRLKGFAFIPAETWKPVTRAMRQILPRVRLWQVPPPK